VGVDLSSNVYLELQWYLFSAVFLLGGSYTLQHRGHVRVDVVHDRLPPHVRRWIDRLGTWLLLVPFCVFVIVISISPVRHSIALLEDSPDPGGLPRWIIKPLIPLGFLLLLLQGIAEGRIQASNEGTAKAGMILGIITTILLALSILWIFFFGGMAILGAAFEQ